MFTKTNLTNAAIAGFQVAPGIAVNHVIDQGWLIPESIFGVPDKV